jgi:PKD repeat protein
MALTANFTIGNYQYVGVPIAFTDTSTGGTPTTWSWVFGDNGTATDQNPSYPYWTAGTYTVSLTVSDGVTTDTITQDITILDYPQLTLTCDIAPNSTYTQNSHFIATYTANVPPTSGASVYVGFNASPALTDFTITTQTLSPVPVFVVEGTCTDIGSFYSFVSLKYIPGM